MAQIMKKHVFRHILVNNYGMTMVEGSLEAYEGVECREINFIQNFQNFRGLGAPKPLFWGHMGPNPEKTHF